ncbi:NUDIX domain-containing protein [Winogradskyella sp. 3972H.M.0a.05]|uniref:NUDIX hydrolase n=1 Tax=Winogradskyella sp. 3972H.M.0a.05 TaxID=2950277 RepID=UPI003399B34B
MTFDTFLELASKIKNLELPGEASQIKMSPPYRLELMELQKEKMKTAKKSAVLALIYPDVNHEANIVLILRNTYKGVHSAQVGFPGGKHEDEDETLLATALRETEEEIGISKGDVMLVKEMTPMYIPPSNFSVQPFLGFVEQVPTFIKDDTEVELVIEIKLSELMDDTNAIQTTVPTSYKVNVQVPALKLQGHIVWGATAMMLSELKDMLKRT